MSLLNTRTGYGAVSRALHWTIVLGIVTQALARAKKAEHRAFVMEMNS